MNLLESILWPHPPRVYAFRNWIRFLGGMLFLALWCALWIAILAGWVL